jgi:putative ABC transport system substrate-binding protein
MRGAASAAFREGLSEAGFVDGRNVRIDFHWAEGQYDRLPAMAKELVGQQVALIVAGGGYPPALAAKAATTTIPIVLGEAANCGRPTPPACEYPSSLFA